MENRADHTKAIESQLAVIFRKRITELMKEYDESQFDLAAAIGVTRDKINNWFGCRSKPDNVSLVKLANHYNVTTDYLLGLASEKTADWDVERVCEFTGLSENTVSFLHNQHLGNRERSYIRFFVESILDAEEISSIIMMITLSANAASIADKDSLAKRDVLHAELDNLYKQAEGKNDGLYSIDAKSASAYFRQSAIDTMGKKCGEIVDKLIRHGEDFFRLTPTKDWLEFLTDKDNPFMEA